jgi:hypothetical protein
MRHVTGYGLATKTATLRNSQTNRSGVRPPVTARGREVLAKSRRRLPPTG